MEKIKLHILADTPCVWIDTHEYSRAIKAINDIIKEESKDLRIWSITKGIYSLEEIPQEEKSLIEELKATENPIELPLKYIQKRDTTVLILLDFHRFIGDISITRMILDIIEEPNFNQLIIISPSPEIPIEIEKYVTLIEFPLPTTEELEEKIYEVTSNQCFNKEFVEKIKNEKTLVKSLANAGKGLTLSEFEEALAISIKEKDYIDITDIFEQKKQLVKKNSALEIFDPKEIDEVKGLERAKEYITKAIKSGIGKGSLLVGVPGTGKSLLAKQIGRITGLPTIVLNIGNVFGSLIGESEKKMSHALKSVEAMAPCILFIDEIEKGLSGISSSDRTDGGTSSRVFGKILSWLNDKNAPVYVIATANDLSKLPPEFLRSGRWNWIFFVDLPSKEEREEILKYYCKKYGVEYQPVDTENFTGAEIKALVENAFILDCSLEEAKQSVIPIYYSRQEEIEEMRKKAINRFIPASKQSKISKIKNNKRKLSI